MEFIFVTKEMDFDILYGIRVLFLIIYFLSLPSESQCFIEMLCFRLAFLVLLLFRFLDEISYFLCESFRFFSIYEMCGILKNKQIPVDLEIIEDQGIVYCYSLWACELWFTTDNDFSRSFPVTRVDMMSYRLREGPFNGIEV